MKKRIGEQDCDLTTRVIGEQEKDISGLGILKLQAYIQVPDSSLMMKILRLI